MIQQLFLVRPAPGKSCKWTLYFPSECEVLIACRSLVNIKEHLMWIEFEDLHNWYSVSSNQIQG